MSVRQGPVALRIDDQQALIAEEIAGRDIGPRRFCGGGLDDGAAIQERRLVEMEDDGALLVPVARRHQGRLGQAIAGLDCLTPRPAGANRLRNRSIVSARTGSAAVTTLSSDVRSRPAISSSVIRRTQRS